MGDIAGSGGNLQNRREDFINQKTPDKDGNKQDDWNADQNIVFPVLQQVDYRLLGCSDLYMINDLPFVNKRGLKEPKVALMKFEF